MITKISIKNFQKHESLQFEVHPNITAIVGQTNAGKTAIMRAINWVVFNKPSGEAFRRWGSASTEVTIFTEEGSVTRFRDNSKNGYVLRVGEQEQVFTGLGLGVVPEAVQAFLGLEPLNFQHQMDPPFLICESGGEIARQLNAIANLGLIDTVLQDLGRLKTQASSKLREAKGALQTILTTLGRMDWIEKAEVELEELEALENKVTVNRKQQDALVTALNRMDEVQAKADRAKAAISPLENKMKAFESLLSLERNSEEAGARAFALSGLLQKLTLADRKVAASAKEKERIVSEFNRIKPDACPICGGTIGDLS